METKNGSSFIGIVEYHTFVVSKRHIKDKCFHIQHVNSIDSRFKRWQKRFNRLITKHLQNYLNWFVFLEKAKNSYDKYSELIKTMFENIGTIDSFRSIQLRYQKLLILQYGET